MINRTMNMSGELNARVLRGPRAPLSWKLRNNLRWHYIKGWLAEKLIVPFANWWGITTMLATLEIVLIKGDGTRIDYGVVSRRVITDTGVAFLVDDWDNSGTDFSNMNFHGLGTGVGAEAVGNTALGTESTTALNPNNTRATGTRSQPAANQYRTVGTLTYDADAAITEHGILDQAATGGGTLWDRSVFAAINVVGANGDSVQTTYTCTVSSGG